jgi:hypothetical protein
MGLEARCRARLDGAEVEGKLHLDSQELSFAAPGRKWKLALGKGVETSQTGEWLRVSGGVIVAEFALGEAVGKWEKKILQPPGLREKLGLKAGMRVWVEGELALDLEGCEEVASLEAADLGLLVLEGREDLGRFLKLAGTERPVWVIYPKGGKTIREADVMAMAQEMGMGASKTAAVNERLTGLRFRRNYKRGGVLRQPG